MPQPGHIVFCNCSYGDVIPAETASAVLLALKQSGLPFDAVADLCRLAADKDPRLAEWSQIENLKVQACFPRAVKWLFARADAELGDDVDFCNMRSEKADDITTSFSNVGQSDRPANTAVNTASAAANVAVASEKDDEWTPWFPVIDYDRCINCKQCLNFCLFGVYELDELSAVIVAKPAGCKTGCPACARVCPQSAIIFPKYKDAPINGDEVKDEPGVKGESGQAGRRPFSELVKGDIHAMLRARSGRGRFAAAEKDADRDDKEQLSNDQKLRRLAMLQRELDIPPEVIANLTPQDINKADDTERADESERGDNDDA